MGLFIWNLAMASLKVVKFPHPFEVQYVHVTYFGDVSGHGVSRGWKCVRADVLVLWRFCQAMRRSCPGQLLVQRGWNAGVGPSPAEPNLDWPNSKSAHGPMRINSGHFKPLSFGVVRCSAFLWYKMPHVKFKSGRVVKIFSPELAKSWGMTVSAVFPRGRWIHLVASTLLRWW